jgi:hypothetical protein
VKDSNSETTTTALSTCALIVASRCRSRLPDRVGTASVPYGAFVRRAPACAKTRGHQRSLPGIAARHPQPPDGGRARRITDESNPGVTLPILVINVTPEVVSDSSTGAMPVRRRIQICSATGWFARATGRVTCVFSLSTG